MGVKGLSKAVIKHVWRDGALGDLPAGTRIGVDAAGWLHKACVYNAQGICLEDVHQALDAESNFSISPPPSPP